MTGRGNGNGRGCRAPSWLVLSIVAVASVALLVGAGCSKGSDRKSTSTTGSGGGSTGGGSTGGGTPGGGLTGGGPTIGGGGGSTGGGSTGGGSTGGGSTGGGSTGGGPPPDFLPPEVNITAPARGAYLTSDTILVEGTATDGPTGTGIALLLVNNAPVTVGTNGVFLVNVTLAEGMNIIAARATDGAGNEGAASIAVMYGSYRNATDEIPNALCSRLNEPVLNEIAAEVAASVSSSGLIEQKLMANPVYQGQVNDPFFGWCIASAIVQIIAVDFDPISITLDSVPGALNADIRIPNLAISASAQDYCGIGYYVTGYLGCSTAEIDLSLQLSVHPTTGAYTANVASAVVTLHGFYWGINGIPTFITNIVQSMVRDEVESRIEDQLRTEVPDEIESALTGLITPISRSWNGRTVTLTVRPTSIAWDATGVEVDMAGNVTAARLPSMPLVPGSLYRPAPAGTVSPSFLATPEFYASLRECILNRAAFSTWQAGFWNLRIDTAFLQQVGLNLPFALNGQLITQFFPAAQGMIPSGLNIPLAIQLEPLMQPCIRMTGTPDLCQVEVGELHMSVEFDAGAGFQTLFEVAVHFEAGASLSFASSAFSLTLSPQITLSVDLLSSPIVPVNNMDLERFLQFIVPPAMGLIAQSIPPLPVPSMQGFSLGNVQVYQDGALGEYMSFKGDVQ